MQPPLIPYGGLGFDPMSFCQVSSACRHTDKAVCGLSRAKGNIYAVTSYALPVSILFVEYPRNGFTSTQKSMKTSVFHTRTLTHGYIGFFLQVQSFLRKNQRRLFFINTSQGLGPSSAKYVRPVIPMLHSSILFFVV